MAWQIELTGEARKELKKLGQVEARRIRLFLRQRIETAEDPRQLGKPLKGKTSELWRYRVGNYRLVCKILDDILIVLIIRIGHRKEVYRKK